MKAQTANITLSALFNGNFLYGSMQVTYMESRLWLCGLLNINIPDIKIAILEGFVEGLEKGFSYADLCKLLNN